MLHSPREMGVGVSCVLSNAERSNHIFYCMVGRRHLQNESETWCTVTHGTCSITVLLKCVQYYR